jgi:hypothetical protein
VEGWVKTVQGHLDYQPHPDRIDGLIECDRRVFEDDAWFCVVEREPLAEGHVRLICKLHVTGLHQLRGPSGTDLDTSQVEAVRSNLIDDLIIAHDVVMGYDPRIVDAIVVSGTAPDHHLYFDIVPVYRFDHGNLHSLGEASAHYEDISLQEKRIYWKQQQEDFSQMASRLREVASKVIRARPGRRRAGLTADEK